MRLYWAAEGHITMTEMSQASYDYWIGQIGKDDFWNEGFWTGS